MTGVLNFQRGLIVDARIAGASITRKADGPVYQEVFTTVSKAMTTFEKDEKNSSSKQNPFRKGKL